MIVLKQVRITPVGGGQVVLLVTGRLENGKPFTLASAPCLAAESGKKIETLLADYDLSNYPWDNPEAARSLGSW